MDQERLRLGISRPRLFLMRTGLNGRTPRLLPTWLSSALRPTHRSFRNTSRSSWAIT